jgi:hypothetical protein
MQGNEAARVDNGDVERKSNENEKLPIEQQSVIKKPSSSIEPMCVPSCSGAA